ncbi:hypothetical protein [Ornithinimicrobium murale]|uniref:hypothetical protein n=1 Tax=Ornithinimicrobium murale TaxID=1050153 RepID=UPI000E0D282E|nr:hypothetical protein [Ornithinimicrobium murale]
MDNFQISGAFAVVSVSATVLLAFIVYFVAAAAIAQRHRHTFELVATGTEHRFTIGDRVTSNRLKQLHGCSCGKLRAVTAPGLVSTTLDMSTGTATHMSSLLDRHTRHPRRRRLVESFIGKGFIGHVQAFADDSGASCGVQVRDAVGNFLGFCHKELIHTGDHILASDSGQTETKETTDVR